MYAIIETGGKQYRVSPGDVIEVERLDSEPGSEVAIDRVLAVGEGDALRVGTPTVEGASVVARVLDHGRGRKIRGFRYKAKVNYRRRFGHRQPFTRLRIETVGG